MKLRIAQEFIVHAQMEKLNENCEMTGEIWCENDEFKNQYFAVYDDERTQYDARELVLWDGDSLKEAIEYIANNYPNEENIYKDYYKKVFGEFSETPVPKKYVVINDRQGGSFGMGRSDTAVEWLEQMLEWRDMDDSWGDYGNGTDCYGEQYLDTKDGCEKFWKKIISDGREQELIDYIAEFWELDFAEHFEYCGKNFAFNVVADNKGEYPFLATVYQLDDDDMPHEVWSDYYRTLQDGKTEAKRTFIETLKEGITKLRKEK